MSVSLHVEANDKDLEGLPTYLEGLDHLSLPSKEMLLDKALHWLRLSQRSHYLAGAGLGAKDVTLKIDGTRILAPSPEGTRVQPPSDRAASRELETQPSISAQA